MALLDDPVVEAPATLHLARIAWAGPLSVLTSLCAVHTVRFAVLHLPGVRHTSFALGWGAVTADTVILCSLAVIVFALTCAFYDGPVRRFRWIAFAALLVSFLPILATPDIGTIQTMIGVAAMHVAASVPCVTLLPWLVVRPRLS